MNSLIQEAFVDTTRLLPLLAAVYFFVSIFEFRYGDRMNRSIAHLGIWGPVAGALFGCMPQCGFSVVASALYVKRLISTGTLLAVFLSTSDEAIPVLLSMPDKAAVVGVLLAIKVAIAIAAGVTVDLLIRKPRALIPDHDISACGSCGDAVKGHPGCCSHGLEGKHSLLKALLLHPLWHTAKIFAYLFVLTIAMNVCLEWLGTDTVEKLLMSGTVFQPVLAALIGLVPTCFASVLLADLYAAGAISFGALVAGLCSGAGLGLLVLVKENKDRADTARVIGLLLAVSIISGVLIQYAR